MFRLRRDKQLIVEFTTRFSGVAELYPIAPARECIPTWFRKMPARRDLPDRTAHPVLDAGTVKTCPAVADLLTEGWVLPLWCDALFQPKDGGSVAWALPGDVPSFELHPPWQVLGIPFQSSDAVAGIRLESVWTARTPPGYSLRVSPLPFVFDPVIEPFPGIIDTDAHHQLNLVMRYRRMDQGEQLVKAGTPIAHLTLVNRRDRRIPLRVSGDQERFAELARLGRGGGGANGYRLGFGHYREYQRRWRQAQNVP